MNEKSKFLLPPGFHDLLSEMAEKEYFCTKSLIDEFYKSGYRLVATPLLEFEDSLFDSSGQALEPRTLKLLDPLSQKMLGIRADITTQVSRLVRSRLATTKFPLKLCYAGDIVRSYAQNTRGQRQLRQVGLEYIDKELNSDADAEVAIIAIKSLLNLGVKDLTIDLNAPKLIQSLPVEFNDEMKSMIEKRAFTKLPETISQLIKASGNAEKAFTAVQEIKLPDEVKKQIKYCEEVYQKIKSSNIAVNVTVDFVENRGFEYHKMFSFSIFAKDLRDELGRGGRYSMDNMEGTGFTVYVNSFAEKIKAAI